MRPEGNVWNPCGGFMELRNFSLFGEFPHKRRRKAGKPVCASGKRLDYNGNK